LAWLAETETSIRRGTWADPEAGQVTLGEWLEHWLNTVVSGRVGELTRANYAQIARRHIIPALGHTSLAVLTAEDIDDLLAAKAKEGLAKTHVSRMRTIMVDALRHAERRGLVARNVAALSVLPRMEPRSSRESLAPDEARRLLVAATNHPLGAMVVLGLTIGLRPGELAGLLWDDCDLEASPPTISVSGSMKRSANGAVKRGDTKRSTAGRRTLALPPVATDALLTYRESQGNRAHFMPEGLVFTAPQGEPVSPHLLARTVAEIARAAGVDRPVVPYTLRHTCVSLLIDSGTGIEEVADLLGDDPRTLYRHYRHKVRPVAGAGLRMQEVLATASRTDRARPSEHLYVEHAPQPL
jgi:integrase